MKAPVVKKELKISIIGEEYLDLSEVEYFQDELKSIAQEDVDKLASLMLYLGVLDPVKVWKRQDGKYYMLDGHTRKLAYEQLKKQGHTLPLYPCLLVDCKSEKHAAEIVLALRTSYGSLSEDGLYKFIHTKNLKEVFHDYLKQRLSYPTINLQKFYEGYFLEQRNIHPAFTADDFAKRPSAESWTKEVGRIYDEFETVPLSIIITRSEKRRHDELKKVFGVKSDTDVYRKLIEHYEKGSV